MPVIFKRCSTDISSVLQQANLQNELDAMNNLFTYISATTEATDKLSIVDKVLEKRRTEEGGMVTETCELLVRFNNGVALQKLTEQDLSDIDPESVCAECWITYEVTAEPDDLDVTPKRKVFTNPCQEAFWLKINRVQAG